MTAKLQIFFDFLITLLVLTTLGVTLLNSDEFGSDSLFPYFLYCFFAGIVTFLIFFKYGISKNLPLAPFKFSLIIFITFSILVWISGYSEDRLVLPHFYWVANSLFLCSAYFWIRNSENENIIQIIYLGIIVFSIIESCIVLLQAIGILETQNYYFLCSGSWNNPNVIAIFLSLSFYAIIVQDKIRNRCILNAIVFLLAIAIFLLFCRTAYLVSLLFLVYKKKEFLLSNLSKIIPVKHNLLVLVVVVFISFFFLAFSNKTVSTLSRIEIWKKSFAIILNKPFFGNGIGLFEKVFNQYQINNPASNNRFVSMPYNDFLEIAVEGGLILLFLWVAFLASLIFKNRKKSPKILLLILGLIIIQLTNFGFNAIPAFVLLLIYLAIHFAKEDFSNLEIKYLKFNSKLLLIPAFIAFLFFINAASLGGSFYAKQLFRNSKLESESFAKYLQLGKKLKHYASFHETLGDSFLKYNKKELAINEFKLANELSSNPKMLTKLASCYKDLNKLDSSEIVFNQIIAIDPSKLTPKFLLLQLYEIKRDSNKIKNLAKNISLTSIKYKTKKAIFIKNYADSIFRIYNI